MVVNSETKLVTLSINGEPVTVPEGSTVLQACQHAGIEVPNLCYQPLLRPWGSCRVCTVEILGRRGGLIESCAAQAREGMEVLTHSPEVLASRQFLLQMYLVDHALDCPTCDKSGECYLQDNTYLHNVHNNPYRRPKLARAYTHLSDVIDYKWDRCIICARCTRVCDEVIGVTAIEVLNRGLEAEIGPAYGTDLRDTTCTSCGMCIAVCPVGALTDRRFGSHPWELDATETICGFCDVGCTLNVEHNRGLVRRVTHLWDRGVNHGYTCERGKWGYDQVQHPDRLDRAYVRGSDGWTSADLDEALDTVADRLRHYQGSQFAALASPDATNEENYLLQQFTRAVMGTNNVDRLTRPNQVRVDLALGDAFGLPTSTNSMQETFTNTKSMLVVGPNIGEAAPVASYWLYWSRTYREARTVVISQDHFPLCDRAEVWIKPPVGQEAAVLNAMARVIIDEGLARPIAVVEPAFAAWRSSLDGFDLETVTRDTGVDADLIRRAALIYATGGVGHSDGRDLDAYPPSAVYQTLASEQDTDARAAAVALNNLALLTGNVGRAGGGVLAFRGPANYQGATDLGCNPVFYPGYQAVSDDRARRAFEAAWLPRWNDTAVPRNGFKTLGSLPTDPGLSLEEMIGAIDAGQIKAMYIVGASHKFGQPVDERLLAVLPKLEFLVVEDVFESPLTELAHVVLPGTMFLEKDGSFTNADRTIQRVRTAIAPPGDAQGGWWYLQEIAQRLGYGLNHPHPSLVLEEVARVAPIYSGVSFPRLERGPLHWPVRPFTAEQSVFLEVGNGLAPDQVHLVAD
ncbi:MAG TPA: molybdopterin-dependent oxidoreductase [Thermomicrobiaceae bacterium]|nr:molybdopterin-dependent oxidoreductase [Thermomicrobiaceae bacterium]